MNRHAILRCDMLQLLHEIAMGKVADLPAPAAAHALEHQVLEDDGVVTAAKAVGELPQEVAPAIVEAFMEAVKLQTLPFPVAGAGHALGEVAAPTAQLQQAVPEFSYIKLGDSIHFLRNKFRDSNKNAYLCIHITT